jgi:ATP-binding cassette, subfamily B, bacterial
MSTREPRRAVRRLPGRIRGLVQRGDGRYPPAEPITHVDDVIPPSGGGGQGSPDGRGELESGDSRSGRPKGALHVLRRGLRESPELRAGLGFTIALSFASTIGRLLVPVLVQQVLDKGIRGQQGYNARFTYSASAIAVVVTILVYLAGTVSYRRLVRASEAALYGMRVRTFRHIHALSIAEQTAEKRGAFVSRVTNDVDTIGQFMEWGAITWILSLSLMFGTAVAMFVYSWQLALIAIVTVAPLALVLRTMQRGMLAAYDRWRTRVGEMLSEISESIMGAAVVRAYGLEARMDRRVKGAIQRQYKAQMGSAFYQASIFPMSDLFSSLALGVVIVAGAHFGPGWGLSLGKVIAFLILVQVFVQPLSELSETFDMTQTAIAGWRKIQGVLDLPVEIVEPSPGVNLPSGALSVRTEGVTFGYPDGGGLVLHGIDIDIAPGSHVAIVGETGCGKTTFAKLLCRLADPVEGRITIGGVDLPDVTAASRRNAVRMVPQDGLLFNTTVRENVRYGREGATDQEVDGAFERLGLEWWVETLSEGLDTRAGERGDNLSVGERQLVALVRAQLGEPGLLILDEATSAVDPETERAISEALEHLSEGRTTVTIAHRLSTAEAADFVLVFDRGRIVERGRHSELAAAGGVYSLLYGSWLGNTRAN